MFIAECEAFNRIWKIEWRGGTKDSQSNARCLYYDSTVVYSICYNTFVGSNNDTCGVEIQHSHS